jgi:hypothetical protein
LHEELRRALAPRYELLKPLGEGGMGAVFLAREPALKRLVAIKVLSPYLRADGIAYARFEREARAVAALSHPNVLSIYAVGQTPELGLPYIVMQFVDGPALSTWIREHGKAGEREARRILAGVAAALAAAHARGLVHRDVKPGNILLEPASSRVLVADFGLASAISNDGLGAEDPALTAAGVILGTPMYMSPEQATGEPNNDRSDVYSLGVVAYELLTGELPFAAQSVMGWAAAHLRDVPPPLSQRRPDLSPEVVELVHRCLAKSAADRPSAQELAEGILPSLEAEVEWPPPALFPLFGRGRALARTVMLTALGVLLLLFALSGSPSRVKAEGAWWTDFASTPLVTGSSLGVRRESPQSQDDGTPRWWFASLAVGLGVAIAGTVWLTVLSHSAVRSMAADRITGWHRSTVTDVMVDPDGRSGLLLKGSREAAAIASDRRARILQARRRIVLGQLLGGLWVITVGGGWAILAVLWILPVRGTGPSAGIALWSLIVIPVGVALGLALAAAIREARLFGAIPRRRVYTGTFAVPRTHRQGHDPAAWYAALLGPPQPDAPRSPAVPGVWRMAFPVTLVIVLLALVALVMTSAAAIVAARRALQLGPETADGAALLVEQGDGGGAWNQARTAWSAYLPPPEAISDSGARRLVQRLSEAGDTSYGIPPYPVDPAQILNALIRDSLGQGVAAAFGTVRRSLPPDTTRLMEMLGEHPRTRLVRQMARARRIDILGSMLDRPVTAYGSLDSLPQPPYGVLRTAAQANALAAMLALARGDHGSAVQRLGENLALADHLLEAPSVFANRFGVGLLQQLALFPLAAVERSRNNRDQAERLAGAADQIREAAFGPAWAGRLAGLAADPHDLSRWAIALRSDRLPPGYRVEALAGGWAGFCLNRWEILGGLSPLRSPAVLQAADAMTDLPLAGGLARLTAKEWERRASDGLDHLMDRLARCWKGTPGPNAISR